MRQILYYEIMLDLRSELFSFSAARAPISQSQEAKMNIPAETTTQVVIVGGGPVGMGLAIELGQRGVRCVVVERYVSRSRSPRART